MPPDVRNVGTDPRALLGDAALRRSLTDLVRRRAPAADVEDLVQSTLADAIASPRLPEAPDELRRWVFAIARNKVADYHRRSGREMPDDLDDLEAPSDPHVARDLERWARGVLPEGEKAQETLDWMLREGEGEKLESIAAGANVPAPQVRKRVSRLRQHLRERWALELTAVALLALLVSAVILLRRRPEPPITRDDPSVHDPSVAKKARAKELRQQAFDRCERREWQRCLDLLDRAGELDRDGDGDEQVRRAREQATDALRPTPPPAPSAYPIITPPDSTTTAPKPRAPKPRTPIAPNRSSNPS